MLDNKNNKNMKNIPRLNEFLNEHYILEAQKMGTVTDKDWKRMMDLHLSNKDASSIANSIKDKAKAVARFVAGLKISNSELDYNENYNEYEGWYSEFGNKALELGATPEEIEEIYNDTTIPQKWIEEKGELSNKKLSNRFVGPISKVILKHDFDIEYLKHNGNAITFTGKEAMKRNGRKWTIGYKAEVDLGDKKVDLVFDAITDEGFGPTYYVLSRNSDMIFTEDINTFKSYGVRDFSAALDRVLSEQH